MHPGEGVADRGDGRGVSPDRSWFCCVGAAGCPVPARPKQSPRWPKVGRCGGRRGRSANPGRPLGSGGRLVPASGNGANGGDRHCPDGERVNVRGCGDRWERERGLLLRPGCTSSRSGRSPARWSPLRDAGEERRTSEVTSTRSANEVPRLQPSRSESGSRRSAGRRGPEAPRIPRVGGGGACPRSPVEVPKFGVRRHFGRALGDRSPVDTGAYGRPSWRSDDHCATRRDSVRAGVRSPEGPPEGCMWCREPRHQGRRTGASAQTALPLSVARLSQRVVRRSTMASPYPPRPSVLGGFGRGGSGEASVTQIHTVSPAGISRTKWRGPPACRAALATSSAVTSAALPTISSGRPGIHRASVVRQNATPARVHPAVTPGAKVCRR